MGRAAAQGALLLAVVSVLASTACVPSATARHTERVTTVRIFLTRGDPGARCSRVVPLARRVTGRAVLAGAIRALLRGPTASEARRGYGGWFSHRTVGYLRSVRVRNGVAAIDFRDFHRVIPNASSSCGSALLLAQLDRTATQFPTISRTVYSFDGSSRAFYEWLQRDVPIVKEASP
jgi:hypothetical protein